MKLKIRWIKIGLLKYMKNKKKMKWRLHQCIPLHLPTQVQISVCVLHKVRNCNIPSSDASEEEDEMEEIRMMEE